MATSSTSSKAQEICPPDDRQTSATQRPYHPQTPPTISGTSNGQSSASTAPEMESLSRALGWLSLGLGLAQVAAPSKVAQLIGVDDDDNTITVMRLVGAREIASGIGILTQPKPTPWLWSRVGGDAMDLVLLRSAMSSPRADQNRVSAATAAVLGIAAVDMLASSRTMVEPSAQHAPGQARDVRAATAVTVNAAKDAVFAVWQGFQSLPRFMSDGASIEVLDDRRSRWTLSAPAGITLEWEIEITESRPNELISWRTVAGSSVTAAGMVQFRDAPGNRGTEVVFDIHFNPPGGGLGRKVAQPFADALGTKIGNDLRRFKQLIELGEIVHSDDSIIPGPNPAQPPARLPENLNAA